MVEMVVNQDPQTFGNPGSFSVSGAATSILDATPSGNQYLSYAFGGDKNSPRKGLGAPPGAHAGGGGAVVIFENNLG